MSWKIATQPATEPVTLAEAKAQLNIPSAITDWDTLITLQIEAARIYVEQFSSQHLITQTVQEYFSDFPCKWLELSRYPIASITSVKYTDSDHAQQTWADTNYDTDLVSRYGRISPKPGKTWPVNDDTINSIVVEYVTGYGTASAVPAHFKQAILLTVGHMFENREDTIHTLPTRVHDLLRESANWQF